MISNNSNNNIINSNSNINNNNINNNNNNNINIHGMSFPKNSKFFIIHGLDDLPPEIGQLVNLKAIWSNDGSITTLPTEIEKLENLEYLKLENNLIKTLPPQIGKLTKLKNLKLSKNELETLPPQIGKLKNLYNLELQNNLLNELPPEIGSLENLFELNLHNNPLKTLPKEIIKLKNLKYLVLNDDFNFNSLKLKVLNYLKNKLIQLYYKGVFYYNENIGRPDPTISSLLKPYIKNQLGLKTLSKLHNTGKLGKLSQQNLTPYMDIIEKNLTGISPNYKKIKSRSRKRKRGGKRKINKTNKKYIV